MEVQALGDSGVLSLEERKSVYSVLATYFNNAEKNGLYVKGYVDGQETFDMFMKEFNDVCKTKFIVRTSWRKAASNLPRRSRYGKSGTYEVVAFGECNFSIEKKYYQIFVC